MRLATIILALTGMAVALVHVRRGEQDAHRAMQALRRERAAVRRRIHTDQSRIARRLTAPALRQAAARLDLLGPDEAGQICEAGAPARPWTAGEGASGE